MKGAIDYESGGGTYVDSVSRLRAGIGDVHFHRFLIPPYDEAVVGVNINSQRVWAKVGTVKKYHAYYCIFPLRKAPRARATATPIAIGLCTSSLSYFFRAYYVWEDSIKYARGLLQTGSQSSLSQPNQVAFVTQLKTAQDGIKESLDPLTTDDFLAEHDSLLTKPTWWQTKAHAPFGLANQASQYYLSWLQAQLSYSEALAVGSKPTPMTFQTRTPDPYDLAHNAIVVFRNEMNCELGY